MEEITIRPRSDPDHPPLRGQQGPIPPDPEVRGEPSPVLPLSAHRDDEILCDEQGPIPNFPPRRYDEQGRPLPFTPEELELRSEIFRRSMAVINANDRDPPGSDEEFMRAIDSRRPDGMKLFEGYY